VTQAKRRAATAARLPFDDSPQYLCRSQKMRLPWGQPDPTNLKVGINNGSGTFSGNFINLTDKITFFKVGLQQNLWVESLCFCAGLCPGPRGL